MTQNDGFKTTIRTYRLVATSLVIAAATFAAHPKIARDLDDTKSGANVDVIIQYKSSASAKAVESIKGKGGIEKGRFTAAAGGLYTIPSAKLKELADDPSIDYISPDRALGRALDYAAPTVGAITAAKQYGVTGKGVGIAILDSGVQETPDLAGRVVYTESFLPSAKSTQDEYGHGTHVAVTAVGDGTSSNATYGGIAPKAKIINLRVLDENGMGQDSYAITAIQRAIELKSKYNIRILNLSLGRPIFESFLTDPLCQAVESAWKAGIFVVVAAGNYGRVDPMGAMGYGTITAPGNDPYVITVGAMKTMSTASRNDDEIASYSSKGPSAIDHVVKPDIVAPGNRIISGRGRQNTTLSNQYPENIVSRFYMKLSGTSVAAPMVAGAAALLIEKDPGLTPDQLKAKLMKTANKAFPAVTTVYDATTGLTYVEHYDVFTVGAGYLDVAAALASKDKPDTRLRAVSPFAVYDNTAAQLYAVSNTNYMCADSAVWGSSAVWGATCGASAVWGSSGVWGTSAVWGSSAVWGTSAVWGAIIGGVAGGPPPQSGSALIWAAPVITATSAAGLWGDDSALAGTSTIGAESSRAVAKGE